MRPIFTELQVDAKCLLDFVYEILTVISRYQAAEFPQLVVQVIALIADTIEGATDAESAVVLTTERRELLHDVISLYSSIPEVAMFSDVLRVDRMKQQDIKNALLALTSARNRAIMTADEENKLRQFIDLIHSTPILADIPSTDIETGLQLINQVVSKSQLTEQGNSIVTSNVPVLRECVAPLVELLIQKVLQKSTMKLTCQAMVGLMKNDSHAISVIIPQYIWAMSNLRAGLVDTLLYYVLEFMIFADVSQQHEILKRLYEDPGDVARAKLSMFVKGSVFKRAY